MGSDKIESKAMGRFGAAAVGLSFMAFLLTVVAGLNPIAFALFPVPVAVYSALGQMRRAVVLVTLAGVSVGLASGSVIAGGYYAAVAASGLVIGLGTQRRWHYGQIVAATSTILGALFTVQALLVWKAWIAFGVAALESYEDKLRTMALPEQGEILARQLDTLRFLKENWAALGPGFTLGFVIVATCIGVSLTARWLRKRCGDVGPNGSFFLMKPPDWLPWVVIAAFGGWYADQQWPHPTLRMTSWNTAIVVGTVYWLNGLAVLGYMAASMRRNLLITVALVFLLISPAAHTVFPFVGLFDTWADFRRRMNELAARRMKERDRDNDNDSDE